MEDIEKYLEEKFPPCQESMDLNTGGKLYESYLWVDDVTPMWEEMKELLNKKRSKNYMSKKFKNFKFAARNVNNQALVMRLYYPDKPDKVYIAQVR